MFSYSPSKFRCIGCISNLRSRGLVSAPATYKNNNYYYSSNSRSKVHHRRRLVLLKISCSSSSAWRWRDNRRSDLRIEFSQMDAAKDILADPSGDISRLSASLAELKNEAQGLAKVNVDKLESGHPTGTGTGDLEGSSDEVQIQVGKSEEDSDVGPPGMIHVGKAEGFNESRRREFGEEVGKTESGSELTTPLKSVEEAAALDEVLGKISAPGEQDGGMESDLQDLTEQSLGKMEGVEERKTQQNGLGDGAEVGGTMEKAENRREPGAKLKEDAAKAMARNAPVGGEVGKTEHEEIGKVETGKVEETEAEENEEEELEGVGMAAAKPHTQSKLEENIAKLHASFGDDRPGIVGRTEGRDVSSVAGTGANSLKGRKAEEEAIATSGETPNEAEENLRTSYQSLGSDSLTGIVGKTEGKEFVSTPDSFIDAKAPGKHEERNVSGVGQGSTPGKMEEDVAKAFHQNAPGKLQEDADKSTGKSKIAPSRLEESLRKIYESLGSDSYTGIVGKTEGKEFVSTPGSFFDAKGAGKHEEGNELGAGQANSPSKTLGKVQEDVGKAVNQNVPGKVQEDVGKALGQTQNVKHQGGVAKVEAGDKAPVGHQMKAVDEDSAYKREGVGKNEVDTSGMPGHRHVGIVIYLASKGLAEAKYVEKLKHGEGLQLPDGAQVIAAAEVTDGRLIEVFDVNWYLKNLHSYEFGRFVLYSPLAPSTHTLLSQNFHSFPTGTVCVAGAQLQGRGRAGNVWQSPKGCLMFSFTIQMTNGRLVPFLQYVVSLAVIEAVEHVCKASEAPSPDLKIKWPNDLYAKGIKVGGVLCTSSYRAKTFNIVVGIGLNVGNREPTTCLDAIIQDLDPQAHAIQQEDLLAAIMSKFEVLNTIFQDQGFTPLQDAYYGKWMHGGQSVILEEKKSSTSDVVQVPVTIQGLTNMGFLLATDKEGEEYELHPDGNSFDFLKGLVRQKVSS